MVFDPASDDFYAKVDEGLKRAIECMNRKPLIMKLQSFASTVK